MIVVMMTEKKIAMKVEMIIVRMAVTIIVLS
jgi:hypothetical protein